MSQELNAVLVALGWCVVLYFILLVVAEAAKLYALLFAMFKRSEERKINEQMTREYIDALSRLADRSEKSDDSGDAYQ
jgi:hypothetical protein